MNKTTLAISGIAFMLAASGCSKAKSSIDPAALLEERCGACHTTDFAKIARKSRGDWEETVTRMMAKGAKLSSEEKKALVKHLAKHYRP